MKKTLALVVLIALAGATSLVAQKQDEKPVSIAQAQKFAGTWKAKFGDKTFFVVTLQMENGKLAGSLRSGSIQTDANGEVDRVNREVGAESPLFDVRVADGILLFKNGNDPDAFEMKLTGANESTLKVLLPETAGTPKLKPFRMTRDSKGEKPAK